MSSKEVGAVENFPQLDVSWRRHLAAFALILAVVIAAWLPFLISGKVVYEDDVVYYYLPAFKFFSQALQEGRSPMITDGLMAGFPLGLSQVGGFDDPLNRLLFSVFDWKAAYTVRIMANYLLSGFFAYLFIRAIGLSWGAGLVGALGYLTAQSLIPGMNILRSNSFLIMPGAFWALATAWRTELPLWHRQASALLGAVIVGESFIAGYTQLSLYGVLAAFAFAVFLFFRRRSPAFFLFCALIFLGGALVALPHTLAVMEYLPVTARADGLPWELAREAGSLGGLIENLTVWFVLPPFHFGTTQSIHVGMAGVLFLAFAIISRPRALYVRFFAVLAAVSILAAFPYPLFWLMYQLPVFSFFRFPPHWLFVASFALSVLAALGYQRRPIIPIHVMLLILALNFAVPAWWLVSAKAISLDTITRTPWVVEEIVRREGDNRAFRAHALFGEQNLWQLFLKPPLAHLWGVTFEQETILKREVSWQNLSSLFYDIPTIIAQDNFTPRRYQRLIQYLLRGTLERQDEVLEVSPRLFEVLGMMGVKYFWSSIQIPEFIGDRKMATEVARRPVQGYSVEQILYENLLFLPVVHAPSVIQLLPEDEDNFARFIQESLSFGNLGFIECRGCGAKVIDNRDVQIEIKEYTNTKVVASVSAAHDGWVIVTRQNVPGWEASVDGVPVPISYANYAFQGVQVPEGEHTVVLTY